MRIAYVCYVAAYSVDGVNEKIVSQIAAWRALGHDVELFALSPPAPPGADAPRVPGEIFSFAGAFARVRATIALARAVRRWRPSVVYVRYDLYLPPLAPCLWSLPVVLEINTDDRRETRIDGRSAWFYNQLTRGSMFRASAGLVCVTNELARSEGVARYGKPTIVIGNAENPAAVSPPAARSDGPLSAVMLVGYMAPWAGVDKLRTLAQALPQLALHVVGDVGERPAGTARANLHFHGLLDRSAYRDILERADFGIGPLALHRKGMHEASPLKVREYLSHGLPVLLAHDDTDFPGAAPWYLMQIANDEDNVTTSLAAIKTWADSLAGRRVPREDVVARIGIDAKEAARVTFFERVSLLAAGKRRPKRRA